MNNQQSNADVQYLVSMFEQELDLLKEYGQKTDIDPASKAYLQSFIEHVQKKRQIQSTIVTDFIDYGTKLMAYLTKNGIKSIDISDKASNQIFNSMITPELLREPIQDAIQNKTKTNGSKSDINALVQALNELNKNPINAEKFKQKLAALDEGVECLENTFGLRCKLELGKAFEDLRNYSKKVSVYRNPKHLQKLANVYQKIMKFQQKQSYKCVIKILASFIQKTIIPSSGNAKNNKLTVELIETLYKQVQRQQPWQQQRKLQASQLSSNTRSKRLKKDDLLKTSRPSNLQMTDRIKVSKRWKEEVQNVDSYEQQEELDDFDKKMIMKCMSSQLHNHQNAPHSYKNQQSLNKSNKAMSIQVTPVRKNQDEVFQTKRKNSSTSMSRNSDQQIVQNVIIIRGRAKQKNHNREPDRFIRVPVLSDQIKIVQVVSDKKSKKSMHYNQIDDQIRNKNLQTISSRYKSSSSQRNNTARCRKASDDEIEKKMSNMKIEMDQSKYYQSDIHQCIGCKYCLVIKEMETYRLQRTKIITPLSLL